MITRNIGARLFLLASMLIGPRLYGNLITPQSPLTLESKADLIVVAVASGATQQGGAMPFSLQVLRVVKGDTALVGTSIPALWTNGLSKASVGGSQPSGVWFLLKAGQIWNVIPVTGGAPLDLDETYYPSPSGSILSAYAYDQNATVQDN